MDAGLLGIQLYEGLRAQAYLPTGGLIAVHARGRSRDAIWQAMQRLEVYGTSGPRILLWFDAIDEAGQVYPMGSTLSRRHSPRFRVRAVGSFEQKPGCPEHARTALGDDTLERLCLGECYNPSNQRRRITRIEVIRIRPQRTPDEALASLIEDPWLVRPCGSDPAGCHIEFEDADFTRSGRDQVYYVRAIEEPGLAVRADPLGCEYDAAGRCVRVHPCDRERPWDDDCLAPIEERAWSSPIFVNAN